MTEQETLRPFLKDSEARPLVRPGGMDLTLKMLELVGFPPGARLLDVCCGGGATVEMLLNAGFDAWGIDLDLMDANFTADILPVICGSAYDLPCEDASQDGIFCECGFSSLEPYAALAEFARVLKTDGMLLISDLYSKIGGSRVGNLRVHSQDDFESLFALHGFELQFFEDHTDALRSFWARQVMEHGSDAYMKFNLSQDSIKPLECGYCLLIARKKSL